MKPLKIVRTKKELYSLYLSQYSEKNIRTYINDIIKQYRPQEKIYKNINCWVLPCFYSEMAARK